MNKKVYFASPLFTEMERDWNEKVVQEIEHTFDCEVYLPQRNMAINDKNAYANSLDIAHGDMNELLQSDIMIAVLDGQVIDAGVAAEVGVAHQRNIPVVAILTDSRTKGTSNQRKIYALSTLGENQFFYANLFVIGLIKDNGVLVDNTKDLLSELGDLLSKKQ